MRWTRRVTERTNIVLWVGMTRVAMVSETIGKATFFYQDGSHTPVHSYDLADRRNVTEWKHVAEKGTCINPLKPRGYYMYHMI
jgi:hypothetical protein